MSLAKLHDDIGAQRTLISVRAAQLDLAARLYRLAQSDLQKLLADLEAARQSGTD